MRQADIKQVRARFDRNVPFIGAELERVVAEDQSDSFYNDLNRSLQQYGNLTDRQVVALKRSLTNKLDWADRRAAQVAANVPDAPTGRIVVTGEVFTTKWVENDFGGSLKMGVADDRGFKVWSTVPASLDSAQLGKGARVTYTVTVTPSPKDRLFLFGKCPKKAQVLSPVEAAPVAAGYNGRYSGFDDIH